MEIITFTTEYMGSHIYFIIEDNHAVVIDPSDFDIIEEYARQNRLEIDMGILTHEHCDHSYGVNRLKKAYHCPIIASRMCNERLQNPKANYSQYYSTMVSIQNKEPAAFQGHIEPFSGMADKTFSDKLETIWEDHLFSFIETPGHTAGSICILLDRNILFSGDSLFENEKTNLRFPSGSKKQYESITIPWFYSLPEKTVVYPGHYSHFLLGERLKYPLV